MTQDADLFPATAAAAQARLHAFAPRTGAAYAQQRNFDLGPDQHVHVSVLSPYVRLRMLDEIALSRAVLDHQSAAAADKFLAEVFWRTYWKGWMELRPGVWAQYQHDLNRLQDDLQTQSGLRRRWETACSGHTGIAPFDDWAQELVHTGYMHNHARMWFASIWVFTLGLPWQLGADFFLRHLLDGDAAVNTLSWRWVAGIQTPGKTYLARADNIARFTGGRYTDVPGLAHVAHPEPAPPNPAPGMLTPLAPPPRAGRAGMLVHSDDVDAAPLQAAADTAAAWAYADPAEGPSPWHMAPAVAAFRTRVAQDVMADQSLTLTSSVEGLTRWAQDNRLDHILTPYAPVGPVQDMLRHYTAASGAVPVYQLRRPLDETAWPLATKGFFPFRKHIPMLIGRFVRGQGAFNLG